MGISIDELVPKPLREEVMADARKSKRKGIKVNEKIIHPKDLEHVDVLRTIKEN